MQAPAYRERLTTGMVHFGPGAFHRAHQADYVHALLQHDPRWGIAAVSLRSAGTVEKLQRQDGLYTLAILDSEPSYRVIGAHNRFVGPGESVSVRALLHDPAVRVVTSTVTEKGYCLRPDGTLDVSHPDVVHDLANPGNPISIVGWLALGLSDRKASGAPPFTPLCCDNMVSNGRKLGSAVRDFARRLDPELARWIEGEVRFPNSMVDSITPATDDQLHARVLAATDTADAIPVSREAFTQWVIEDVLPAGGPDLGGVGVTLAKDVEAWERAKLRILNGAHSTLAYIGTLLGHQTVADAMADPYLAGFVETLVRHDIIPTLQPSPIDLEAYARAIFQRFRNPVIHHKLTQIAWDGSQKLPYRLLDGVAEALAAGRSVERFALPIASWIHFIRTRSAAGIEIVDPLHSVLQRAANSSDPVAAFLDLNQVFREDVATNPQFRAAVAATFQGLSQGELTACLSNTQSKVNVTS
ncbi:MAG: mannitol dehydrogenase family protein [Sphingomicrobium sp.]